MLLQWFSGTLILNPFCKIHILKLTTLFQQVPLFSYSTTKVRQIDGQQICGFNECNHWGIKAFMWNYSGEFYKNIRIWNIKTVNSRFYDTHFSFALPCSKVIDLTQRPPTCMSKRRKDRPPSWPRPRRPRPSPGSLHEGISPTSSSPRCTNCQIKRKQKLCLKTSDFIVNRENNPPVPALGFCQVLVVVLVLVLVRLPGVVLVGEWYRTNALTDKVDRKRHLEESFHLTWMKIQLLKREIKNKRFLILIQNMIIDH